MPEDRYEVNGTGVIIEEDDGSVSVDSDAVRTEELPNVGDVIIQPGDDPQSRIDGASVGDVVVSHPNVQFSVYESPLSITTDELTLIGLNLQTADGADVSALKIMADDIVCRNLSIDGNKANQTTVGETGGTVNGITVTNASNITIEESYIHDTKAQGVVATSYNGGLADAGPVENVEVRNCRIKYFDVGGIVFAGGGGREASVGRAVNNDVSSSGTGLEALQCIDGWQTASFEDNYVSGQCQGIALEQHDNRGGIRPLKDITFRGGTIDISTTGVGFDHAADSFQDILFDDVTFDISGSGVSAIDASIAMDLDGFTVQNCTIVGDDGSASGTDYGINLNGLASMDNLSIQGGTFRDLTAAVKMENCPLEPITVANIQTTNVYVPVSLDDAAGATITGCTLTEFKQRGLAFNATQGSTVNGIKITDCHIASTVADSDGIQFTESNGTIDRYIINNVTIDVERNAIDDGSTGGSNKTGLTQGY